MHISSDLCQMECNLKKKIFITEKYGTLSLSLNTEQMMQQ